MPLAYLTDPACAGALCKRVQGYVTTFITQADPVTGWIGPPSDPNDGNAEWARWLVLFGLEQHWEFTGDTRVLPAIYKHLHESYNRLANHAPLVAWAGARWQDYAWLIQVIMDADPTDSNGQRQFLTAHLWLVAAQQEVVWEECVVARLAGGATTTGILTLAACPLLPPPQMVRAGVLPPR